MFSIRSLSDYFANAFTFSIGGGVGEAAMYGALFGAAKSAVSGEDILGGMVSGGILSAATAGVSGQLLGSGADVAATAATQVPQDSMVSALTNAGTDIASNVASQGIAGQGLAGLGGMQNIGLTQGMGASVAPTIAAPLQTAASVGTAVPGQGITSQLTQPTMESTVRNMAGPDSMVGKGLDWWNTQGPLNKAMYSGLAGGAYGALTMPPPELPGVAEEEENPMGLATYDRSQFTPYTATPNVYRPQYAEGGIAGMGDNKMFPQGLQDHTQYATPSQRPTSAEVVGADYEQVTNPFSGEPVGMAEGGTPADAVKQYMNQAPVATRTPSASIPVRDPAMLDIARNAAAMAAQRQAMQGMNGPGHMSMSGWVSDANPYYSNGGMGNQQRGYGGGGGGGGGPVMGQMGTYGMSGKGMGMASTPPTTYMAKNFASTPTPTGPNTNVYRPQYAEGGITGFSLGGYAHGGNPRLLDGPGDGMSDDIPAVIGNKQPARLAQGEFVVPADVVSHLGNGSTDAGAKHLYNMMDKVRKARTGNKKQGKKINPAKYMLA